MYLLGHLCLSAEHKVDVLVRIADEFPNIAACVRACLTSSTGIVFDYAEFFPGQALLLRHFFYLKLSIELVSVERRQIANQFRGEVRYWSASKKGRNLASSAILKRSTSCTFFRRQFIPSQVSAFCTVNHLRKALTGLLSISQILSLVSTQKFAPR